MKNLKEIIHEKLKISHNTKIDTYDNMYLLDEILYVVGINKKNYLGYPKNKLDFFKEEIQDWISKNHINKVKYYTDEHYLKIYGDLYVKENKDIIDYFEKDFDNHNEELQDEYRQSHQIYSNKYKYCELRCTENTFIIIIQDPTHNIKLRFYIVKANEKD